MINVCIAGLGYIGSKHIDAVMRTGCAQVIAVCDPQKELVDKFADAYGIKKRYTDFDEMLKDDEIQAVHNCTPNIVHLDTTLKTIKAGKHLFLEKPIARNVDESRQMVEAANARPDVMIGVNFCYRMFPNPQAMKRKIAEGEIGEPRVIHGSYLQDWLLYDTDYNWRLFPEASGKTYCVGDIGSHWMDMAQTVSGHKIVEVCALLKSTVPVRKKPIPGQPGKYELYDFVLDDYAAVLLKFDNGASGVYHCGAVCAGHKVRIDVEVDGEKSSFYWSQENPDQYIKGNRDTGNEVRYRNWKEEPDFFLDDLMEGHVEGYNDAFKYNVWSFYQFISEGKNVKTDKPLFATLDEAHYIMRLIDATALSSAERRWVSVDEIQ